MRTILVTGGAGFIGSHFAEYALREIPEIRVIVLDALTYAGRRENIAHLNGDSRFQFVHGNIKDRSLLEHLLSAENVQWIAHFAAESHVDRSISGPEDFIQTNVAGTGVLLDAVRAHGWRADGDCRFLHVSTDEVFGPLPSEGAFLETSPYRPGSPYAASKAAADHLVRAYYHTYKLPVLIAHGSNNFGPRQFPEKLIPRTIVRCLRGESIPVFGQGENVREWLYVTDFCEALARLLFDGSVGESYNVGSGNEWKNIDLVRNICRLLDEAAPADRVYQSRIMFVADRAGHDFRYALDSSKIRTTRGWFARTPFNDALRETVAWYVAHREWWADLPA